MKAPKEIREWVSRARSRRGRKNGVVSYLWDAPEMERKLATSKKYYQRHCNFRADMPYNVNSQ